MPLTLKTINAPEDEPLDLAELKEQLRIDGDDQDATIGNMATAAREYCEEILGRQLMPATLQYSLDRFPSVYDSPNHRAAWGQSHYQPCNVMEFYHVSTQPIIVPRPPLITLTPDATYTTLGISYVDGNGATQTLSSALYQVDARSEPGRIVPAYGQSWPSTREQLNAVTITYRAGYTDADAVPKRIKQAIGLLAAHWYENREAVGTVGPEIEFSVCSLLQVDRVGMI